MAKMRLSKIKIKTTDCLLMPNWMSMQKQPLLLAGIILPRLPVVTVSTPCCKETIFHIMIILYQSEKTSTTCFSVHGEKIKL